MVEEYCCPATIEEAIEILDSRKGDARIIAGGTDLAVEIKEGVRDVMCLVDITRINGLNLIEEDGDEIRIGAGVTFTNLIGSKLIHEKATALVESALTVGSPQIQNVGTLVGNVVNAQPAADGAVAMVALEGEAEILSKNGLKTVPVKNLYEGVGRSTVDSTREIVIGIRFKALNDHQGSAFQRLSQREALALPMLNAAVKLTAGGEHCASARVVVAPVAPRPFISRRAEDQLLGAPLTRESFERASEVAASEAKPRDSALRGSSDYRRAMVKVLVRRALENAFSRIRMK